MVRDNCCEVEERVIVAGVLPIEKTQLRSGNNIRGNKIVVAAAQVCRYRRGFDLLHAVANSVGVHAGNLSCIVVRGSHCVECTSRQWQRMQGSECGRKLLKILVLIQAGVGPHVSIYVFGHVHRIACEYHGTCKPCLCGLRLNLQFRRSRIKRRTSGMFVDFKNRPPTTGLDEPGLIAEAAGKFFGLSTLPARDLRKRCFDRVVYARLSRQDFVQLTRPNGTMIR